MCLLGIRRTDVDVVMLAGRCTLLEQSDGSPGVCLRRTSLAYPAPIVDVENLVQPLRGCFTQLQFGSPIKPSKLIDGPNADNC
ncbi:MAG TPA: hypothetical protein VFP01_02525, partial [Propionibacteriaceae bacterium]|nr:hypothetical protein [Propionibacteriaceae bacterium]